MPSSKPAEIVVDLTPNAPLADVIPMPQHEPGSFYTRNSGDLPRLEHNPRDAYGRAGLPKPIEAEPDTFFNRLKDFLSVNRPSWLS